nr:AraC family transcriptional regulator [Clostridium sp. UBA6640]
MCISRYTNSIKITMAENLLTSTELSIDEISKMIGYNYSENFIKIFKKFHGKTPLAFRKMKG